MRTMLATVVAGALVLGTLSMASAAADNLTSKRR